MAGMNTKSQYAISVVRFQAERTNAFLQGKNQSLLVSRTNRWQDKENNQREDATAAILHGSFPSAFFMFYQRELVR